MKLSLNSSLGFLRLASLAEGVSFVVLVGIAMPLKYLANQPMAVKIAGMAHGLLFILLCILLFNAVINKTLRGKLAGLVFLAALLPLGPFFADRKLAEEDREEA